MATQIYFAGTGLKIPGAYSMINTDGMFTKYEGGVKVLALLGESTGGEPGALNFIDEPAVGRKILKGGELLKACEKAWNPVSKTKPGVQLGGASRICAIRTNQATKSTYQSPNFLFQSKDWGRSTQYFITLADGALDNTKSLVVYDPMHDIYENYNNIGNLFTVKYVGDAEDCLLSITEDAEEGIHFKTQLGSIQQIEAVDGAKATGVLTIDVTKCDLESGETFEIKANTLIECNGIGYITDEDLIIDGIGEFIVNVTSIDETEDANVEDKAVDTDLLGIGDIFYNEDIEVDAKITANGGIDADPGVPAKGTAKVKLTRNDLPNNEDFVLFSGTLLEIGGVGYTTDDDLIIDDSFTEDEVAVTAVANGVAGNIVDGNVDNINDFAGVPEFDMEITINADNGVAPVTAVKAEGTVNVTVDRFDSADDVTVAAGDTFIADGKEYILKDELVINDVGTFTVDVEAKEAGSAYNITDEDAIQYGWHIDIEMDMTLTADGGVTEREASEEMVYEDDLDLTIDKHNYHDYRRLANDIASYDGYIVDTKKIYNTNLSVYDIDPIPATSIKDRAYRLTAIAADLHNTLKRLSEMVEISDNYEKTVAVENIDYVQLTGGEEGQSPVSWVKFFDSLSQFDIFYIVPLTDDPSVHAELYTHCKELSGVIGKERRAIVGGHSGETIDQTCDRARIFVDSRVQVVHGGFYDYNADNELELYPPYILAAALGGRAAFLDDGEPATHDVFRMAAPEYKLSRTDVTDLLDAGCCAFEYVLGDTPTDTPYTRLVQDLTTDTLNKDSIHTERATGALADSILKEIRRDLDELLTGKRTAPSDLETAKNRIVSILTNRLRKNQIVAYRNIYLTKTGTVTEVYMDIAPAEPNNFTLITAFFYSQTLTAADGGQGVGV